MSWPESSPSYRRWLWDRYREFPRPQQQQKQRTQTHHQQQQQQREQELEQSYLHLPGTAVTIIWRPSSRPSTAASSLQNLRLRGRTWTFDGEE